MAFLSLNVPPYLDASHKGRPENKLSKTFRMLSVDILKAYTKTGAKTVHINKRYIVDEQGNPKEVVISMEDFRKIEEVLGLDLEEEAVSQLRQARKDRESGNEDAYVDLDSI